MQVIKELRKQWRQIAISLLGITVIGYFGYHAVEGDRGLRSYFSMKHRVAGATAALEELRAERTVLEHRVRLLRPDGLDLDLLEERAREILNVVHEDEIVILLPRENG